MKANVYLGRGFGLPFLFSGLIFLALMMNMAAAGKAKPSAPKVLYGLKNLPPFVQKMHAKIYRAARSGDLETMRTVLETNELLPLINDKLVRKPVDFWKQESSNGDALSIFSVMTRILEAGYVKRKGKGGAALYVWPYFAETGVRNLEAYQKIELYRIGMGAKKADQMLKTGKYTFYSLGIGEDGTWHFFGKN